jgi:hypothetical protein
MRWKAASYKTNNFCAGTRLESSKAVGLSQRFLSSLILTLIIIFNACMPRAGGNNGYLGNSFTGDRE